MNWGCPKKPSRELTSAMSYTLKNNNYKKIQAQTLLVMIVKSISQKLCRS